MPLYATEAVRAARLPVRPSANSAGYALLPRIAPGRSIHTQSLGMHIYTLYTHFLYVDFIQSRCDALVIILREYLRFTPLELVFPRFLLMPLRSGHITDLYRDHLLVPYSPYLYSSTAYLAYYLSLDRMTEHPSSHWLSIYFC